MVRGTFDNPRLRNAMAGGEMGQWTAVHPGGERCSIYAAAQRHRRDRVPLIVVAGRE